MNIWIHERQRRKKTFSAVQIYGNIYHHVLFDSYRYITNSQYDQLPLGLIAQLTEHCNVRRPQNPVQAWIFYRLQFHNRLRCVYNSDDQSYLHMFLRSSNIYIFTCTLCKVLRIKLGRKVVIDQRKDLKSKRNKKVHLVC